MSSEGGGVMSMGWLERWMVFVGSHMGGQNGMFFNRAFSEGLCYYHFCLLLVDGVRNTENMQTD